MDFEFADTALTLIDSEGMKAEYTPLQRELIKVRVLKVLDLCEQSAKRSERWDTTLFVMGFLGSILVTMGSSASLADLSSTGWAKTVGSVVAFASCLATVSMGFRERLKFKEAAIASRRTASQIQRALVLFVAHAGDTDIDPSGGTVDAATRFTAFLREVEAIKVQADETLLRNREGEDGDSSGAKGIRRAPSFRVLGSGPAPGSAPFLNMNALPLDDLGLGLGELPHVGGGAGGAPQAGGAAAAAPAAGAAQAPNAVAVANPAADAGAGNGDQPGASAASGDDPTSAGGSDGSSSAGGGARARSTRGGNK